MLFFKRKFNQIKCINGCDLFEDNNNFSYWENNEVTSDEKEIVLYLNTNGLNHDKKIILSLLISVSVLLLVLYIW